MKVMKMIKPRAQTLGITAAVISAVCYGLNPLGALNLYAEGMNTASVLFGRFLFGSAMLFGLIIFEGKDLRVTLRDLLIIAVLGVLFGISALSLYASFHYMAAGVASTLLFLYPVLVALIMAVCFHEPLSFSTLSALGLSFCGVAMLSLGDQISWDWYGALLVLISISAYAVYMVIVNKSPLRMSSVKLSAYVMIFCTLTVACYSRCQNGEALRLPQNIREWCYILMLALVPCVFSMVFLAVAIRQVGSTVTAVLGALEPITAVLIGVSVFHEPFTPMLLGGILLILLAVTLITTAQTPQARRVTLVMTRWGTRVKLWRWKHGA